MINERIKEIKSRIKNITAHFSYSDEIINILTLCYLAITTFDNEVEDILEEVLSTRYILVNSGEYDKMLKKYYPLVDIYLDTYMPPSFDDNRVYKNDFIIISNNNTNGLLSGNTCNLLDSFIHEIKHAMNSIINIYDNQKGYGIFYCGLSEMNNEEIIYKMLDETFNSFMVKIYLNILAKLSKDNIQDEQIKKILESFNFKCYHYSYSKETRLLEPLFCNAKLFPLFYNAALYKDYNVLFDELEPIFNGDTFYVLNSLLDNYYNDIDCELLEYFKYLKNKSRTLELIFKL